MPRSTDDATGVVISRSREDLLAQSETPAERGLSEEVADRVAPDDLVVPDGLVRGEDTEEGFLSEAVAGYLSYLAIERGRAQNTIESYARDLLSFETHLGQRQRNVFNAEEVDVEAYVASLRTSAHPRSIQRALSAIRGLYAYLDESGQRAAAACGVTSDLAWRISRSCSSDRSPAPQYVPAGHFPGGATAPLWDLGERRGRPGDPAPRPDGVGLRRKTGCDSAHRGVGASTRRAKAGEAAAHGVGARLRHPPVSAPRPPPVRA
ncbi:MAG: site-specific integrase, partial [Acidimicrobiales bacterium]